MKPMIVCVFILSGLSSITAQNMTDTSTFRSGLDGWSVDFADYPAGEESFYELAWGLRTLPSPLDTLAPALMVSGNNHSDDLFMFMKKCIAGLRPESSYLVRFDVTLASNAPTGAIGVGGPPGEGVTIKCGVTTTEPGVVLDASKYFRMDIDKGNQSGRGEDMDTIGHVGVADTTTHYTLISRSNAGRPFLASTDRDGKLWVIIGTDSGFESTTTLFYSLIVITLEQKPVLGITPEGSIAKPRLSAPYPSPFNGSCTVSIELPKAQSARLTLFDCLGRPVVTLVDTQQLERGSHSVFVGSDRLDPGMYYFVLETREHTIVRALPVLPR
jgi:hypothetical protein